MQEAAAVGNGSEFATMAQMEKVLPKTLDESDSKFEARSATYDLESSRGESTKNPIRAVDSKVVSFGSSERIPPIPFYRGVSRRPPYVGRWSYLLSIMSFSLGLGTIWRFPSVLIELSGGFESVSETVQDEFSFRMWTILMPLAICLLTVIWPLLVAEGCCAQLVMGGVDKVYASISPRMRSSSISFIAVMAMLTFIPYVGAVSFNHLLNLWGESSPLSKVSGELHSLKCNAISNLHSSSDAWPVPPLCCLEDCQSLVPSLHPNSSSSLEPFSTLHIADELGTGGQLRPSFSLYCGEAMLEKVLNDQDIGVVPALCRGSQANTSLNYFNWETLVGMTGLWLFAFGFVMFGNSVMQWIRPIFMLFSLITIVIIGFMTMFPSSSNDQGVKEQLLPFHGFLTGIHISGLRRPEIWAVVISQSLFSLGLAQGVVPNYSSKRDKFTENVVMDQQINICFSTLLNVIYGIVIAACAQAGIYQSLNENVTTYTDVLTQMLATAPMKETWLAVDTMFGNWQQGKGWIFCFYLSTFFVSANQLASLLDTLTTVLAGRRATNLAFILWGALLSLLFLGLNVILSWAVGYPLMIALQHYAIDIFLPLIAYFEATAIGWCINLYKMRRHLGGLATWAHLGLYHVGCWTFALTAGLLYDYNKSLGLYDMKETQGSGCVSRYIGLVVGVILILLSIIVPPFLCNSTDGDGSTLSLKDKYNFIFWRNIETLRHQINVGFCHNSWARLSSVWSISLKYIAPLAFAFSFATPMTQRSQLYWFSAYLPFNYSDYPAEEAASLPVVYLFISAIIPIFGISMWFITISWPQCLFRCTAADANPLYYDPLDAFGMMADDPILQEEKYLPFTSRGVETSIERIEEEESIQDTLMQDFR